MHPSAARATSPPGSPRARRDATRALAVSALSFRYPRQREPVLHDVSFEVLPGQSLGLLGANGSGKSTLLNALLRVRPGDHGGEVTLGGVAGFDRILVGYATQQIALYQQLTVVENVRHVARTLLPRRSVAAAVDRTLDEFGLTGRAGQSVHRLSGGWARLTHLAASFVHDPPLRLLDEPTAALDFETRTRLVELVDRWRQAGATVVVTSHYPEDIEEMCTDAVVMGNGTVGQRRPVADLLAGYHQELVIKTVTSEDQPCTVRIPLPATVGDLGPGVADLLATSAADRLLEVHTTGSRLRDVLVADPRLQEVLDAETL